MAHDNFPPTLTSQFSVLWAHGVLTPSISAHEIMSKSIPTLCPPHLVVNGWQFWKDTVDCWWPHHPSTLAIHPFLKTIWNSCIDYLINFLKASPTLYGNNLNFSFFSWFVLFIFGLFNNTQPIGSGCSKYKMKGV